MARRPHRTPDAEIDLNAVQYYLESVDLHDVLPINVHLHSAKERTMISLLGAPSLPLTTHDQPERASALAKALKQTAVKIAPHVVVTGIRPAIESLRKTLAAVFAEEPNLAWRFGNGRHDECAISKAD